MSGRYDIEAVKRAASGRWVEIISSIGSISADLLDSRHHPCPKPECSAKTDGFRAFDDVAETGGVICNQCFNRDNNDGFKTLQWLTGKKFGEVLAEVAERVGIEPEKSKKKGRKLGPPLPWSDLLAATWCLSKKPISVSGLKACHAEMRTLDNCGHGQHTVIALPVHGEDLQTVTSHTFYKASGGAIEEFEWNKKTQKYDVTKQLKVCNETGGKSGVIGPVEKFEAANVVWKTEGPPDLLALLSFDGLPDDHTAITNMSGANETPFRWLMERLAEKSFYIVPDSDDPGEKGAAKWANAAAEFAREVRIVRIPEADGIKDLRDWLAAGHTLEELLHLASESPIHDKDPRPTIVLSTDEYKVNDAAAEALGNDPSTFQRGGMLVHIIRGVCQDDGDGIDRPKEQPRIAALPEALVRDRLTRVAKFQKVVIKDGDVEYVDTHPPAHAIKAVAYREHWPAVRYLAGVTSTAVLRPDGSVLCKNGYDQATGIFADVGNLSVDVPESPTREQAQQAAAKLLDVVSDFPFENQAHRSGWLALVLTLLCRHAFRGPSPLFLVDANSPGSGKTLLLEIVSWLCFGRPLARMSNPTTDAEMEKRIAATAIRGDQLVLIDNVHGSIGTPSLDAAPTSTVWQSRLLGESKMLDLPLSVTWCATANNVTVNGDLFRRVVYVRLIARDENPEKRQGFRIPNLVEYVSRNRQELLQAALTIVSAYCRAGRPNQSLVPWGSFEGWSSLIRGSIVWCGLADPGENREKLTSDANSKLEALRRLLANWETIDHQGKGVTAGEIIHRVSEVSHTTSGAEIFSFPEARDAVREFAPGKDGAMPDSARLGLRLKQYRQRVVDGKFLESEKSRANSTIWKVVFVASDPSGHTGSGEGIRVGEGFYNPEKFEGEEIEIDSGNENGKYRERKKPSPTLTPSPSPPKFPPFCPDGTSHDRQEKITCDGWFRAECEKCGALLEQDRPPAKFSRDQKNEPSKNQPLQSSLL